MPLFVSAAVTADAEGVKNGRKCRRRRFFDYICIDMATIGIFDSGSGGLSVYRELVKVLPKERYVYFSDNAHCPYGEKTAEYIQDRARAITDILLGMGADIIVVACNTATAAAIATLRAEYPEVPFIGMEPAVKPAALGTKSGVIGVLATAGTLKGSKYLKTRGLYEDDVKIVEHVGQGFVELVEGGILDGPQANAHIVAFHTAGLIIPGLQVINCGRCKFLLEIIPGACSVIYQVLGTHEILKARFVDIEQPSLGVLLQQSADKGLDILCEHRHTGTGGHHCQQYD